MPLIYDRFFVQAIQDFHLSDDISDDKRLNCQTVFRVSSGRPDAMGAFKQEDLRNGERENSECIYYKQGMGYGRSIFKLEE